MIHDLARRFTAAKLRTLSLLHCCKQERYHTWLSCVITMCKLGQATPCKGVYQVPYQHRVRTYQAIVYRLQLHVVNGILPQARKSLSGYMYMYVYSYMTLFNRASFHIHICTTCKSPCTCICTCTLLKVHALNLCTLYIYMYMYNSSKGQPCLQVPFLASLVQR